MTAWKEIDADDSKLKAINESITILNEADYKVSHVVLTSDGHVIDLNNMTPEEERLVRSIIDGVDHKAE